MLTGSTINCEGCGEKEAEVECADCAPKGADCDPLPLCKECCARVHIGHGRLSKHRVVELTFRKQQLELKAKFERCQDKITEVKKRKIQVHSCKEDIDERVRVYERQIRETTMNLCKKIKQRALTLIKKMKDAASNRAKELDGFEKYLNSHFFPAFSQIRKELNNLDSQPVEEFPAKIKAIEEQIDELDFSCLKTHLPSSCLEYNIDFAGLQDGIKALDFQLVEPKPVASPDIVEAGESLVVTETPTYFNSTIEEGMELKICIQTAVNKTGEFWLQPDFPTEVYDKLLDISHKIRQEYICNIDWKPFEPTDRELNVGTLCCVLYQCDNKWYRGCIEDLRSDKKSATVRYVDFGNTAIHMVSQILPYKCMVKGVPFQAFECRLSGLTEELSHEAKWMFNDMVRDKLLDCKFLQKVPVSETHSIWTVELKLTQDDGTVLNINGTVKEKAESKTSKEAITCRDIRLADENLPSSFKIISSTVKANDENPGENLAGGDPGAMVGHVTEGDQVQSDNSDGKKTSKDQTPCGATNQDVRNVVYKSQDIRSVLPRTQDGHQSASPSQDIRHTSQDVRKTPSSQPKDTPPPANQDPMDEATAFLSSIGLGEPTDDDQSEGEVVSSSQNILNDLFSLHQNDLHSEMVLESCRPDVSEMVNIPTVTEIESFSGMSTVQISDREERHGTWIPSGSSYASAAKQPAGKPPSIKKTKATTRSLEQEAHAVVANIIQDVVSRFCVNGTSIETEEETEAPLHSEMNFLQDLGSDLQSRGSDEPLSETSTITPLEGLIEDKENTHVKSILTQETETQVIVSLKPYPKLTKSLSNSNDDINVKDSMLKPEIQDKSLGNLCRDDPEETSVKRIVDYEEVSESDPQNPLSLSMNNPPDSLDPTYSLEKYGSQSSVVSVRPEEDLEHVQTCDPSEMDDISLFARLPRIMLIPGSSFDVNITSPLLSDGSFFIQIARTDREEAIFNQFLEKLLDEALKSKPSPILNTREIILAPFGDSWYRAEINQVNPDQTVTVTFVDYGNTETTLASEIRTLPEQLSYIPHQTTRCSIASYNRPTFTAAECEIFDKIVLGKKLTATVVAQGYGVLQVTLTLRCEDRDQDVLMLVDKELRRFSLPSRSPTNNVENRDSVSEGAQTVASVGRRPILAGQSSAYTNVPYTEAAPLNYMYYPPQRGLLNLCNYSTGQVQQITHNYRPRRETTLEPYSVTPASFPNQKVSHPQRGSSQSPSRLPDDAYQFRSGVVYISPLKTDISLNQQSNCGGQPIAVTSDVSPSQSKSKKDPVEKEKIMTAGPLSITSEPSSSFFDEDAWVEFESNKWPSCESLPSGKQKTGTSQQQSTKYHQSSANAAQHSGSTSHQQPQSRQPNRHRPKQRPNRRRNEQHSEGNRSGYSSDSSDRTDRKPPGTCHICNKAGHWKNQCPLNQSDSNRSKGMRNKQWRS